MTLEIVGRDEELATVRAFLDGTHDAPAALVLEGDAGIGKSMLWLAGCDHARGDGLRVLTSRPAEAERGLAHAGLGDLFADALGDVLPALPLPRRRALEIALLLEEAAEADSVDHRAVSVAVQDALQLLSSLTPILIAIDDVQWLDPSSSSALAFALRRLTSGRILLLVTRRVVDVGDRSELERALPAERVNRVAVGSLSAGALHRLLHDRLGRSFPRQTLLRIHERSRGNPFFALELARVVDVDADPLEPLPLPATLDGLVRARLAGLPATTRDALALASALGTPSESLLERAGVASETLEPAVAAHVIERDGGTIRFTHPLLSSALYRDLGEQRRSVHERIAVVADDPIVRARHLALAVGAPDAGVAQVAEDAASLAANRGAAAVAAELAELALRLTPPDESDQRHRRALAAARAQRVIGEWTRAKTIASDLLAEREIGLLRAETLVLLAELESLDRAVELIEEALRNATSEPALRARILCRLAWTVRFKQGFAEALEHARAALRLADHLGDDALRVEALGIVTFLASAVGDPQAAGCAQRAREIATAVGDPALRWIAINATTTVLGAKRDVDAMRPLLEREYEAWRDRDELKAAHALSGLASVELWAGRWGLAAEYAARSLEISIQYGLEVPWYHLPISVVAAHQGDLELARTHSERALQLGEQQFGLHPPVHLGTLGVVAFQRGDLNAAAAWFDESEATTTRLGWAEAAHRWWVADHVETLLELGRPDDAVRVLDAWEADASRLGRGWVLAHVVRCRGLVAAAHGAVDEATALLAEAVVQHASFRDAFGQARALLALGAVRRRARQKRAAREALEAALKSFEQLGAATWADKARAELGRIGGRTRSEALTPAQRRVAALVAEGRTNREVAAALFLSEHTVRTHLSHVYAKLGVRSRSELARTFRPDEQSSGEPAISN
jgi:DNA-binding CsgD family transcriptional regulator